MDLEHNVAIGPPAAQIGGAVREALADIPFQETCNLILDPSAVGSGTRIVPPKQEILQESRLDGVRGVGSR